jgi:hypothetical protein
MYTAFDRERPATDVGVALVGICDGDLGTAYTGDEGGPLRNPSRPCSLLSL